MFALSSVLTFSNGGFVYVEFVDKWFLQTFECLLPIGFHHIEFGDEQIEVALQFSV